MSVLLKYIWPAILSLYGLILLYLVKSNNLQHFIHPRLHVLTYLAIFVLILLIVEEMRVVRRRGYKKFKLGYCLFFLPLLLAMVNTEVIGDTSVAQVNGTVINGLSENTQASTDTKRTVESDAHISLEEAALKPRISHGIVKAITEHKGPDPYLVTDDVLLEFLERIHSDIEPLIGKKVRYVGMVYKADEFKDTELVVGRMLMFCCAADMQLVGILSETQEAKAFVNDDWVEVTGVLSSIEYKMPGEKIASEMPYLIIETIEKIEPPEEPYVYY